MIINYSYSQNFNISGIVYNTYNQPLKDASIVIKDSEKGVFTDKNGEYTLKPEFDLRNLKF